MEDPAVTERFEEIDQEFPFPELEEVEDEQEDPAQETYTMDNFIADCELESQSISQLEPEIEEDNPDDGYVPWDGTPSRQIIDR